MLVSDSNKQTEFPLKHDICNPQQNPYEYIHDLGTNFLSNTSVRLTDSEYVWRGDEIFLSRF